MRTFDAKLSEGHENGRGFDKLYRGSKVPDAGWRSLRRAVEEMWEGGSDDVVVRRSGDRLKVIEHNIHRQSSH